ncbi:MAG: c-type cytochrome [Pyrinomonadaceae bacterium]
MKLFKLVLAASAVFLISGCSKTSGPNVNKVAGNTTPAAAATPDEFAFARANFAKHCSACHGDEGKGGLVKVEDVKLKVPSLTEGRVLKHQDDDYVDQIRNGGDGMPKFKDKLSPEEIQAMVRFVRHEFQGK